MAISRIGGANNAAANGGAVTVTLPGSMATDDLILIVCVTGDTVSNDPSMTTAGYTDAGPGFMSNSVNSTVDVGGRVFYKYHNGSDTTAVMAAGAGGADCVNAAALQVFRGVRLAADGGPFDSFAEAEGNDTTSGIDPPSLDHSGAAGIWIVAAGGAGHTGGATVTLSAPTNYTNMQSQSANDTADAVAGMCVRSSGISDPENPGAMTLSAGGASSRGWVAATFALVEPPAGGAGAAQYDYVNAGFYPAIRQIEAQARRHGIPLLGRIPDLGEDVAA